MTRKSFQSALARHGTEPIEFDVDGETFYALPVMPGDITLQMAVLAESTSTADKATAVHTILDACLLPDSAIRFGARMAGGENPITIGDATDVVRWLMAEVYAPDRPTVGASPSPSGS